MSEHDDRCERFDCRAACRCAERAAQAAPLYYTNGCTIMCRGGKGCSEPDAHGVGTFNSPSWAQGVCELMNGADGFPNTGYAAGFAEAKAMAMDSLAEHDIPRLLKRIAALEPESKP